MARKDDRAIGERGKTLEAVVHRLGVASGQIGASATIEEERVPGDKVAVDEEALAAGGVPRSVQQLDVDRSDAYDVAGLVGHQLVRRQPDRPSNPRGLGGLNVDGDVDAFEERRNAFDRVPHHRPADVIGVVVRGDHAGHRHAVGGHCGKQIGDGVGRVDEHAMANRSIADGVDEVDHLAGERIVGGEVATAQQLAEVQPILRRGRGRHDTAPYADRVSHPLPLERLEPGQAILVGGDRYVTVSDELAASFQAGDRLIVVAETGDVLHVPAAEQDVAAAAVDAAAAAFRALANVTDDQISMFFAAFADRLSDPASVAPILDANGRDMVAASAAGRSTTRLALSERMVDEMIAGLRGWEHSPLRRDDSLGTITHDGWSVDAKRAPLGVVGFVFEGRPNVFADAAGVVRTGNTVVMRIGSDALGTAEAIVEHALAPALAQAGLPSGTVSLVRSRSRAAGWALFSDARLALAVARGSGHAVRQLGAVARHAGTPVSVHGTGGAWLVAGVAADPERFTASVKSSLDRKVCNTLNVCCIPADRAGELVPRFLDAVDDAAAELGTSARLHVDASAESYVPVERFTTKVTIRRADGDRIEPAATLLARDELGTEWEWEGSPEVALVITESVGDAVALHNTFSPRFIASLISDDPVEQERFYAAVDAPFVGDGFTRWVDGQYALDTPELGLSNWQFGRLIGRGGVLSGDSIYTVRHRATIDDPTIHR